MITCAWFILEAMHVVLLLGELPFFKKANCVLLLNGFYSPKFFELNGVNYRVKSTFSHLNCSD